MGGRLQPHTHSRGSCSSSSSRCSPLPVHCGALWGAHIDNAPLQQHVRLTCHVRTCAASAVPCRAVQVDDPVFQQWFFLTRRHLQGLAREQEVCVRERTSALLCACSQARKERGQMRDCARRCWVGRMTARASPFEFVRVRPVSRHGW